MTIHVAATYENGVLRPAEPLDLPNRTLVTVTVVPQSEDVMDEEFDDEAALEAELRTPPNLSAEEIRRAVEAGSFSAPSLPVDFDRDDIYSDHD